VRNTTQAEVRGRCRPITQVRACVLPPQYDRIVGESSDDQSAVWMRPHRNGMDAIVFSLVDRADKFAIGAVRAGRAGCLRHVVGTLDEARAEADLATGCPQPCTCPPWEG
jgi:hypothetical protein